MTRFSRDELRSGCVWNGFDYALQVWVRDGVVGACAHPLRMRTHGYCCNQGRYAGLSILAIPGAEERAVDQEPDAPDVLTRVIRRQGYIIKGELERLPPDLPVVITLERGARLALSAAQAVDLTRALDQAIVEAFVPAKALTRFSSGS